jgi:5'-3' exonuclease
LTVQDGYINESGVINLKRIQVVLGEMALWEQEIFQKEYADLNWYKGKQTKHLKEMELARKRAQLGTNTYLIFFDNSDPICSSAHYASKGYFRSSKGLRIEVSRSICRGHF